MRTAINGHMTARGVVVAAMCALFVLAASGLVAERVSRSPGVGVDPHGTALPAQRQVQLSLVMPSPSDSDGLHAKLVGGTMPTAPVQATVLTDAECQPDARGISRCLNRLRLRDGSELGVRHPHDMAMVPCLAPGEHVLLLPTLDS